MKILFLVPYPTEGASNRIRVEQFIPYLESRGVICRMRPFVGKRLFRIIYSPGRYLEKIFWVIMATMNRLADLARAVGYDIVFIHREAYPFGGPFIETVLHWMRKPLVFDFDDAIFLPNTSEHNVSIEWFKRPKKTAMIIKMSGQVIAGNGYLKNYSLRYNKNTTVIPSCVDTDRYTPDGGRLPGNNIVIGWFGSNTTKTFLYNLEEVFLRLSARYRNLIIKVVGAYFYSDRLKNVISEEWSLDKEMDDLRSFDIGIMPMPDDDWTKGKCGFKAILYMACGIPVVASPVGVNRAIIEDGVTGFLADTHEEWERKLSILIEDGRLRKEMGLKGREKAVLDYSVKSARQAFYDTLKKVYDGSRIKD